MFRSASLFIGTSFTVAVFTIFATSNVDSIVGIPHKIYSMQRILILIISRSLCWMCPSAPRVCSEPGGQKPALSLSLNLIRNIYELVQYLHNGRLISACFLWRRCGSIWNCLSNFYVLKIGLVAEFCIVLYQSSTYFEYRVSLYTQVFYSVNGKTSFRQISWGVEAARLGVLMIVSFWNLAGISTAPLPRRLSNFRTIEKSKPESRGFDTSRDLGVIRLTA